MKTVDSFVKISYQSTTSTLFLISYTCPSRSFNWLTLPSSKTLQFIRIFINLTPVRTSWIIGCDKWITEWLAPSARIYISVIISHMLGHKNGKREGTRTRYLFQLTQNQRKDSVSERDIETKNTIPLHAFGRDRFQFRSLNMPHKTLTWHFFFLKRPNWVSYAYLITILFQSS